MAAEGNDWNFLPLPPTPSFRLVVELINLNWIVSVHTGAWPRRREKEGVRFRFGYCCCCCCKSAKWPPIINCCRWDCGCDDHRWLFVERWWRWKWGGRMMRRGRRKGWKITLGGRRREGEGEEVVEAYNRWDENWFLSLLLKLLWHFIIPWRRAPPEIQIVDTQDIRADTCHRRCRWACGHTRVGHSRWDSPYRSCTHSRQSSHCPRSHL